MSLRARAVPGARSSVEALPGQPRGHLVVRSHGRPVQEPSRCLGQRQADKGAFQFISPARRGKQKGAVTGDGVLPPRPRSKIIPERSLGNVLERSTRRSEDRAPTASKCRLVGMAKPVIGARTPEAGVFGRSRISNDVKDGLGREGETAGPISTIRWASRRPPILTSVPSVNLPSRSWATGSQARSEPGPPEAGEWVSVPRSFPGT